MLRGKTLSVPIIHAVHRSKAKDYAMDIQGTTTGFTKLHLKATIISQNVEWRNQAPTIRIRWEITDHHRQILGDMAHRVDWRAYQEFEVTAWQGSGAAVELLNVTRCPLVPPVAAPSGASCGPL